MKALEEAERLREVRLRLRAVGRRQVARHAEPQELEDVRVQHHAGLTDGHGGTAHEPWTACR